MEDCAARGRDRMGQSASVAKRMRAGILPTEMVKVCPPDAELLPAICSPTFQHLLY